MNVMKAINKKIKTNLYKAMLLVGLSCTAVAAQAQGDSVRFERRELTVEDALLTIMEQTSYTFAINHSRIDVTQKIVLNATGMTLEQAIEQILAATGNEYEIIKRYIVIKRTKSTERQPVIEQKREQYDVIRVDKRPADKRKLEAIETRVPLLAIDALTPSFYRFPIQATTHGPDKLPRLAIKSNLLQAITLTLNLGFELGISKQITLELGGGYNPWKLNTMNESNKKLVYWIVRPEIRYWTRERFNGHFLGAHLLYGRYNISNHDIPSLFDKQYRYEGSALGVGISYGYSLMIDKRWSMEFNAGIGAARMEYKRYDCRLCDKDHVPFKNLYVGPTRLGITIAYMPKRRS
jgi:hypothetical protein